MIDLYNELIRGENTNKVDSYLDILKKQKRIVLFGAGLSGRIISKWLLENSISPLGFVDSDLNKVGISVNGVHVYEKKWLLSEGKEACIVVSCGDYGIILDELKNMGLSGAYTMYIDPKWITDPDGLKEFICQNIDSYQKALETLTDKQSQDVYINMLKYKISYDDSYIKTVCGNCAERYFDKELIDFKYIKNYVDAGGYNGDTLKEYINKCNDNYDNIYVFEPNETNMIELNKNVKYMHLKNVNTFQIGLSDKSELLSFNINSGIATRISEEGTKKIKCDSLDNILTNRTIDFIKMDIEGAELKALMGASEIIKRCKPNLAICVYHKPQDYFEIPLKIKELSSSYKIYFRQYEFSDTETICYAIGD